MFRAPLGAQCVKVDIALRKEREPIKRTVSINIARLRRYSRNRWSLLRLAPEERNVYSIEVA